MKNFKILEHTTDLKVKAQGKNLAELFKNTAVGMFLGSLGQEDLKFQQSAKSAKKSERKLEISANDLKALLVNFLNELIFLSDTYNEIYLDFKFGKLSETELKGVVYRQAIPEPGFKAEVKAATFHDLKMEKTKSGFEATILFDI